MLPGLPTVKVDGNSAAVSGVILDLVRSIEVAETGRISLVLTVRPDRRHRLVFHRVICPLGRCNNR